MFGQVTVLVRGGGDLASGVIYRLQRAGFPVVVTELGAPLFVRRTVSYGEAVYSGVVTVEGITAKRVADADAVVSAWVEGCIPVLVDDDDKAISQIKPLVVVDARMAKVNLGTRQSDAALVVALGPGFCAGEDCHAVVETNRGHFLGRVIWQGSAEPNSGEPGVVMDKSYSRVLRAPHDGHVQAFVTIGDQVESGQKVAVIDHTAIIAPFAGTVRGLIHERVHVRKGTKVGDIDPRAVREHCFTISDKSLAIGGAVLEAVLSAPQLRTHFTAS